MQQLFHLFRYPSTEPSHEITPARVDLDPVSLAQLAQLGQLTQLAQPLIKETLSYPNPPLRRRRKGASRDHSGVLVRPRSLAVLGQQDLYNDDRPLLVHTSQRDIHQEDRPLLVHSRSSPYNMSVSTRTLPRPAKSKQPQSQSTIVDNRRRHHSSPRKDVASNSSSSSSYTRRSQPPAPVSSSSRSSPSKAKIQRLREQRLSEDSGERRRRRRTASSEFLPDSSSWNRGIADEEWSESDC